MQVKRTYGSRSNNSTTPTPVPRTTTNSTVQGKRKRPLADVLTPNSQNVPTPLKRQKISATKSKSTFAVSKSKQKRPLTQLHFVLDQTTFRACPLCGLSYTKGAPEDETLHRSQCARVQRGMEWGREEERESTKAGVVEVASQVKIVDGRRGRIISCSAECTGKIGSKITALLQTINLTLSSPPLTQECLRNSKIYLFLLPSGPSSSGASREKIIGCVVAQRISTAMAIASKNEKGDIENNLEERLVVVDSGTGLFCHPDLLPTPMGIPRLFVPSTYRRQGIASALLNAAAATFIHGCPLDPKQGEVAFTQPTGDGKALMMKWGGGGVRIYEE